MNSPTIDGLKMRTKFTWTACASVSFGPGKPAFAPVRQLPWMPFTGGHPGGVTVRESLME